MNMTAGLPSLQIAFSSDRVTRLLEVPVTTDDSGVSTQSSASENRGVSGAGGVGVRMGGGVCSGLPPPPQAERDKAITMITERMAEKFLRYQKWIGLYTELFRKSVDLGD